jgi:hypothetical protein
MRRRSWLVWINRASGLRYWLVGIRGLLGAGRSERAIVQQLGVSKGVMISIVPLLTDLKLRLMHSFKVNSVRHTPFKPEGVPARTLTELFVRSTDQVKAVGKRKIALIAAKIACSFYRLFPLFTPPTRIAS